MIELFLSIKMKLEFDFKDLLNQFSMSYLFQSEEAHKYFQSNIPLSIPIEKQFSVRDYFLDNYLNDIKVLKDETKYKGLSEKRIKTYLVLALLAFNSIHYLY